jgi:hypothetical protein
MTLSRACLVFVAAGLGATVDVFPNTTAQAELPQLQMLNHLEIGRWELRQRDTGGSTQICVGTDRSRLIQIRHPDLACDRVVLEDAPSSITVQYTCRGHGYGRTRIRRENGQLAQIDTQGIAEGLPFDLSVEGRRTGDCQP